MLAGHAASLRNSGGEALHHRFFVIKACDEREEGLDTEQQVGEEWVKNAGRTRLKSEARKLDVSSTSNQLFTASDSNSTKDLPSSEFAHNPQASTIGRPIGFFQTIFRDFVSRLISVTMPTMIASRLSQPLIVGHLWRFLYLVEGSPSNGIWQTKERLKDVVGISKERSFSCVCGITVELWQAVEVLRHVASAGKKQVKGLIESVHLVGQRLGCEQLQQVSEIVQPTECHPRRLPKSAWSTVLLLLDRDFWWPLRKAVGTAKSDPSDFLIQHES